MLKKIITSTCRLEISEPVTLIHSRKAYVLREILINKNLNSTHFRMRFRTPHLLAGRSAINTYPPYIVDINVYPAIPLLLTITLDLYKSPRTNEAFYLDHNFGSLLGGFTSILIRRLEGDSLE